MASPQAENGYTKIANELMDALIKTRIPGEARQVLDLIIRKTYGFNKKEDAISLSQFCVFTSMKKPAVVRAIYKLLEMKMIIKKDNGNTIIYMFNKDFEVWQPLSKKIMEYRKPTLLKQYCYICGFQDAIEEHHIEPRAEGGSNKASNKIMLCPNCHTLTHKGKYTKNYLIIKKDNVENVIEKDNENAEKEEKPLSKKIPTKETLTKAIITKDTYGDFVKLTSDEYDRLCSEFTKQATDKFIEEVNEVFHMKPKVKKEYLNGDHNRLIRNWKRKGYFDNSQKGGNNGTHQNTGRAVGEIDYSIDRGK